MNESKEEKPFGAKVKFKSKVPDRVKEQFEHMMIHVFRQGFLAAADVVEEYNFENPDMRPEYTAKEIRAIANDPKRLAPIFRDAKSKNPEKPDE